MLATALLASGFSFVVLGHMRGGPGNGVLPTARYAEIVAEVTRLKPSFVVLTGDLVYGDFDAPIVDRAAVEQDWIAVDAVFTGFGCPIFRVPGNHDVWEPTTRDLWVERYGALNKATVFDSCKLIFLNTCWTPKEGEDARCPPKYIRGVQLDRESLDFVRAELHPSQTYRHVFVFQHAVLWWDADAAWWNDVHPLLAQSNTRAVFAGDLGPWKFSSQRTDEVDYIQSSMELANPPVVMQRNRESIRMISEQLDNFAYVRVDGADVKIEIRTLGALSTDLFTPAKYRDVHEYDAGTFERKVFRRMETPEKLVGWLWKLGGAAFVGGVVVALGCVWLVRKRRA